MKVIAADPFRIADVIRETAPGLYEEIERYVKGQDCGQNPPGVGDPAENISMGLAEAICERLGAEGTII